MELTTKQRNMLVEIDEFSHYDVDINGVKNDDEAAMHSARVTIGAALETGAVEAYFDEAAAEALYEKLTEALY